MKKIIKKSLLVIAVTFMFFACSNDGDEDMSGPKGAFLTINGDTRELVNKTNDPELRITNYITFIPRRNLMNLDQDCYVIGVEIKDPNRALVANFGGYNIPSLYVDVRFFLPVNYKTGEINTQSSEVLTSPNNTWGNFMIHQELLFFTDNNQKINIKDEGNRYVVEFNKVTFGDGKATLSGRFYVNKT